MKKIVGILDYDMGNLFSVIQACRTIGLEVQIVTNSEELKKVDALILPGVGSFKKAMDNINKIGILNELTNFSNSKPIMGICLGFQLLFKSSTEFGKTEGLGIIDGQIEKFDNKKVLRIPHMGWNSMSYIKQINSPLQNIENHEVYFVHSYFAEVKDKNIILSKTEYCSFEFCSAIYYKNIFGTQFHPEKSGKVGLNIYKNWAKMNELI